MLTYAGIAVLAWAVFAVVAICLGKAAALPAPRPERREDDFPFDWPERDS